MHKWRSATNLNIYTDLRILAGDLNLKCKEVLFYGGCSCERQS